MFAALLTLALAATAAAAPRSLQQSEKVALPADYEPYSALFAARVEHYDGLAAKGAFRGSRPEAATSAPPARTAAPSVGQLRAALAQLTLLTPACTQPRRRQPAARWARSRAPAPERATPPPPAARPMCSW